MHDVVTLWRHATAAEVCWLGPDERPECMPATPLVLDDVPCVALPYSDRDRAAALGAASEVAFAVTDARSLHGDDRGATAFGAVMVTDDVDGSLFTQRLLDQELLKYPPSRTLADSLLLRRENWWWLPRLIVRLDRITRTDELAARTDAASEALLVRDGLGLRLDAVTAKSWDQPRVRLDPLDGQQLRGDGAPTLVLGHDHITPDFERWESWTLRGRLWGDELAVEERGGKPGAPLPPLRLFERIRRQRALGKACRYGITAAERRS